MKTKIFSGIDSELLMKSALYLVIAVSMIVFSFPAGVMKGNSLGTLLYFTGFILLFYAWLRPWANAKYYLIQYAVLFVIFALLWFARKTLIGIFDLGGYRDEDIAFPVGIVCLDGFIGCMIGIVVFSEGFKCLVYSAANLALLAIFIMFPQTLSPDPDRSSSTVIIAYIFLILQFACVIAFFFIASAEQRSPVYKTIILLSGLILIFMGLWGILAFKPKEWLFGIRWWSIFEIISGILAVYAFGLSYSKENQHELGE